MMRSGIPRKLWLYWHQGWDAAPDVVRRCAATWRERNPTWRIHMLDAGSVAEKVEIPRVVERLQPPLVARSDVIRVHLLRKYGGVWADATVWCARPLDEWVDSVTEGSGFFAYDKPGPRRPVRTWPRPISTWFLAAGEGSRIIVLWCSGVRHLLKKTYAYARYRKMAEGKGNGALFNRYFNPRAYYLSKRYRYGDLLIPTSVDPEGSHQHTWPHNLFQRLLDQNREFRDLWESTPKLSAHGPHLLLHEGYLSTPTDRAVAAIRNRDANVIKLTHKVFFPEDLSGTLLDVLYSSFEFR